LGFAVRANGSKFAFRPENIEDNNAAVALIRTLFLQHNVVCYVLTLFTERLDGGGVIQQWPSLLLSCFGIASREGKMTDWVPVLIVTLIVVCATAYLLLIKWIAAAVATSRADHRSLRSDLDSGNTITVPKSKSVLTVEGQHASCITGASSDDELTATPRQSEKSTASQDEAG